ncbi:MAG: ATP synthase F0 subunit B [Candidatus Komeilibacteria bacterium CG10_big_fil_rev_8_21_14_0_10_41_13]|uniref:ATP synthase subunit b n=1 Tax=Candidatus Komeilibacteria bacterium CG10_big_fil_rev_8_21_14_0_10_41_13 TaxID=1974476 RepID=A0A2M6WC58_9BACT|nr:MAG: ATP synthase F0 subunit B [Candidatus Komeilibacteria bacterium CG10_big_fil_rev_8_21_14_0_10_41_13]
MDELIKTFHIDWKLLVAQIVNFGIVLFVLWRFALKPLMKIMDKRTREIEKSLDDAKKIETNLMMSERAREEKIIEAKQSAVRILTEAREQAKDQGQNLIDSAKGEVQTIVAAAKEQMTREKTKMLEEVKGEVSQLIVKATEKVLVEVADAKLDQQTINKVLRDLD